MEEKRKQGKFQPKQKIDVTLSIETDVVLTNDEINVFTEALAMGMQMLAEGALHNEFKAKTKFTMNTSVQDLDWEDEEDAIH